METTKERKREDTIRTNLAGSVLAALFVLITGTPVFAQASGNQLPAGTQIARPSPVDLTGLATAPDTQTYKLPNGRTITKAEIRAALDAQIAPKLKGPFVSARRPPSGEVNPAQLARESAAIFAETKAAAQSGTSGQPNQQPSPSKTEQSIPSNAASPGSKVQLNPQPLPPKIQQSNDTSAVSAPGSKVQLNPQPLPPKSANVPTPPNGGMTGRAPTNNPLPSSVGSTTVQQQAQAKLATSVQPCSERSPYIGSFKGTITPGGAIGLTGSCFGSEGLVRIFSANPGPNANVLLELHPAWTDTALAVAIPPDITGQIDQPVQVEIVRADGKKSADLNKVFIAARDPTEIEVPAHFIVSAQCGNPGYFGNPGCGNRQAVHTSDLVDNDFPPTLAGTDIWKVQLPKGWQLTTLSTYNDWGGQTPIPESGFEVGPPESATFQFNWQSQGVNIQTNNIIFYTEKYYQLAKYSIMIKAIGPRGVSMPSQ